MKKVFTSKELLIIDEILNKYGSDSDTTVTAFELGLLTKLYEDYQNLVRHIDKIEADNDRYINTIKNMKENFTDHLNALEAENHDLKDSLENKEQVIERLNKECRDLHNTINIFKAANSNQSHEIHELKKQIEDVKKQTYDMYSHKLVKLHFLEAENEKLKEKVAQLHTIKKSFEVLRALYLGDYEDDEPF